MQAAEQQQCEQQESGHCSNTKSNETNGPLSTTSMRHMLGQDSKEELVQEELQRRISQKQEPGSKSLTIFRATLPPWSVNFLYIPCAPPHLSYFVVFCCCIMFLLPKYILNPRYT